jgi:hypothetical protein
VPANGADSPFILECPACRLGAGLHGNGLTAADVVSRVWAAATRHEEYCGAGPDDLSWSNRGPLGLATDAATGAVLDPVSLAGSDEALPHGRHPQFYEEVLRQPRVALLPEMLWVECAVCKTVDLVA